MKIISICSKTIKRVSSNYWFDKVFFVLIFIFTLITSFSKHEFQENWTRELYADAAGYYSYLPAIAYNFKLEKFPIKSDSLAGNGFILDYKNNKIYTKYSCGVALLQAPFVVPVMIYMTYFLSDTNYFTETYDRTIDVCGAFYLAFGLFFIWKFLKRKFSPVNALFSTVAIFIGTNVYFYAITSPGMSHIYSFFFVFSSYILY